MNRSTSRLIQKNHPELHAALHKILMESDADFAQSDIFAGWLLGLLEKGLASENPEIWVDSFLEHQFWTQTYPAPQAVFTCFRALQKLQNLFPEFLSKKEQSTYQKKQRPLYENFLDKSFERVFKALASFGTSIHQQDLDKLQQIVTERTKALKTSATELKTTQDQLNQSKKLAGIGILSAGVAHEINNPLQAVFLKTQYILKHLDDEQEVRYATGDIIKYVKRMADIVSGLANTTQSIKPEDVFPVDLGEIIRESLELAYHSRNFNEVSIVRNFETVPEVYGNKGQCQQIFVNLIQNAIDAMNGSGKITLSLHPFDNNFIEAIVEDNGCGIPNEDLNRIFTPLFTTKATGKGTGLGLHLAYRLMQQHGGEIQVKSKVGVGSHFLLHFPIHNVR